MHSRTPSSVPLLALLFFSPWGALTTAAPEKSAASHAAAVKTDNAAEIDFKAMPQGSKLGAPWTERKAADDPAATFHEGGNAGLIRCAVAGSMCVEHPWPDSAKAVEVTMDCGNDNGDIGWGPGLAFVEDGQAHRFVVRPESGTYEVDGEAAGRFDRKKPVRMRVRMEGLRAICEATQEGEAFLAIATIHCGSYPAILRIGKVGIDGSGTAIGAAREPITCRVLRLAWTLGGSRPEAIKPFALLDPPMGITPKNTREPFSGSTKPTLPRKIWTATERKAYEARVKWFHDAKYGLFFHYLSGGQWTPAEWNAWVDQVDVEKVADQAKEVGAGYVILSIGQNQIYACAPNPVIARHWGEQYSSKRDLPMDLADALAKRGIPLMLYFATDNQHVMPAPVSFKGSDRFDHWVEVAKWYSDHYGTKCKGWWVDGLTELAKDYRVNIHNALKHGNPDALVASGTYEISDFIHGHCMPNWQRQSTVVKPFFGRWDPDYQIQWQVFQYIGDQWGRPGCSKKTEDLVKYAEDVVRGGGVITFDIGTFTEGCFWSLPQAVKTGVKPDGSRIGPFLAVPDDQMQQLRAVRDALKKIAPSDGSGKDSAQ